MATLPPGNYVVCDPADVTSRRKFPFLVRPSNGTYYDQRNGEYVISSERLAVIPWDYTDNPEEFENTIRHAFGLDQVYSPIDQWIWSWKDQKTLFHSMVSFECDVVNNLITIGPITIPIA
jgi:hypothetical protein